MATHRRFGSWLVAAGGVAIGACGGTRASNEVPDASGQASSTSPANVPVRGSLDAGRVLDLVAAHARARVLGTPGGGRFRAAGRALSASSSADGGVMRVASVAAPEIAVDVVAEAVHGTLSHASAGASVWLDAAPASDVVHASDTHFAQELRLVRAPLGMSALRWFVRPTSSLTEVRVVGGAVEVRDRRGVTHLRSMPAQAWDADGRALLVSMTATPQSEGVAIALTIDDRAARYPIVVDPDWVATAAWAHPSTQEVAVTRVGTADVFLAIGGKDSGGVAIDTVSRYQYATDHWDAVTTLGTKRRNATAQPLGTAGVIVMGGDDTTTTPLSSVEIYDGTTASWSAGASMHVAREQPISVTLTDGRILVAGGTQGGTNLTTAELYDPTAKTWTSAINIGFTTSSYRGDYGRIAPLAGGKAILVDSSGAYNVFDGTKFGTASSIPSTGGWARISRNPLPDGKYLVVDQPGSTPHSSFELDPTALTFTPSANENPLYYPTEAAPLPSGAFVAADGISSAAATYTTASGWSSTMTTTGTHTDGTPAFHLANGDVLFFDAKAEIYEDLPAAASCTKDTQCDSGHCVDGVCCDKACGQSCEACDVVGHVGVCSAVTGAPHGTRASCGADCSNVCNGVSHICAAATSTSPCGTPSCAAGTVTGTGTCSGAGGTCVTAPVSCGGYACADGKSCKTTCASSADCAGGAVCDTAAHTCAVPAPDAGTDASSDATSDGAASDGATGTDASSDAASSGAPDGFSPGTTGKQAVKGNFVHCKADADCATVSGASVCSQGVCCDKKCDGTCVSCALPATPGICSPVPVGFDPKKDCDKTSSCLSTCDGSGACRTAFAGSQCQPSVCTGTTTGVQGTGPAYCTATGVACPTTEAVPFDCSPFICEAAFGACRTTCNTSQDCAPGNDCASHDCVPSAGKGGGGGCQAEGTGLVGSARWAWLALAALVLARRARTRGNG